jgi:hypothetical protein
MRKQQPGHCWHGLASVNWVAVRRYTASGWFACTLTCGCTILVNAIPHKYIWCRSCCKFGVTEHWGEVGRK